MPSNPYLSIVTLTILAPSAALEYAAASSIAVWAPSPLVLGPVMTPVLDGLVELLIVEHSFLTRLAIDLLWKSFHILVEVVDEDIFALKLL